MKKLLLVVAMVLLSGAVWGQMDSKYGVEEYRDPKDIPLMLPGSNKYLDPTIRMWVTKEQICKENPPDSRYRLEQNDVTNKLRITENKNGEWKEIENDNIWNCPNWSEDRIRKYLARLRRKEQAEKAWRPIK